MVNAMHADGAGTKSILAYLYWKETGDISVWRGIAQDALVMNLDDLLCIGARNHFLVSSTIGRNKRLIPGEVIKEIIEGTQEFCDSMQKLGIHLSFSGGETADVGDLVQTIIVDSNIVVRFPSSDLIEASQIPPGQVIVGLSSSGQSTYESQFNSGIASNGITLARHCLLSGYYPEQFPECSDPDLAKNGGYFGPFRLTDKPLQKNKDLGSALLSPTRTFAPLIKSIFENLPKKSISGIIHNTGGGHGKAKKFIHNIGMDIQVKWEIPEIFKLIQCQAGISWQEMMQTFNCGIRLQIFCDPSVADEIIKTAKVWNIDAFLIGETCSEKGERISLHQDGQTWSY